MPSLLLLGLIGTQLVRSILGLGSIYTLHQLNSFMSFLACLVSSRPRLFLVVQFVICAPHSFSARAQSTSAASRTPPVLQFDYILCVAVSLRLNFAQFTYSYYFPLGGHFKYKELLFCFLECRSFTAIKCYWLD